MIGSILVRLELGSIGLISLGRLEWVRCHVFKQLRHDSITNTKLLEADGYLVRGQINAFDLASTHSGFLFSISLVLKVGDDLPL